MGLNISEEKTKYLKYSSNDKEEVIKINSYNIQTVQNFKYLGVIIYNKNVSASEKTKQRIQAGYKAYYANKTYLNTKYLSIKAKIQVYKTLIRPVVTYATETWTMTEKEEEDLRIFERRILRKILGPTRTEENELRPRMNFELIEQMQGENIITYIKSQRIKWLGHVVRADKKRAIRKITEWTPAEIRRRGRPRIRWMNDVEEDLKKLGVQRWKEKCINRREWAKIAENAKTNKKLRE